jgi:hypothetical protein
MTTEENEAEFGLVMPFVVVESQGGPFDDMAYVCGYEACAIDAELQYARPKLIEKYVHTENVAQVDLIAMQHGYTFESTPWADAPEDWTWVTLRRMSEVAGSV